MLDVLLSKTDWMHACGGKGRCTTCKARVLKGMEHLPPRNTNETRFYNLNKLRQDERLTCQVTVEGDLLIEVPKESQLPHLTYD